MSTLQLDIPNLNTNAPVLSDVRPGVVRQWLSHLNLTDVEGSVHSVISSIEQYNQSSIDPVQRVQIMNVFVPVVTQLAAELRKKLKGSVFPLDSKNIERADLMKQIMKCMADSFKIAVLDLDSGKGDEEQSAEALLNATYASIKYLAEQLLSAWLIYAPEPQGAWAEVNCLYSYTGELGIHDKVLPVHAGEKTTNNTIQVLYKKIVLLAISNPYHLMEGEATTILNYLDNWSTKCSITPHPKDTVINNQFYIDLKSGNPPCFASDYVEHKPGQGMIIGVDALSAGLSSLIHNINEKFKVRNMPIKDRMNRDLLIRLEHAWGGRTNRQYERFPDSGNVLLSVSLDASHYFVSGQKEFEPEKNELISKLEKEELASNLKKDELTDKNELGRPWELGRPGEDSGRPGSVALSLMSLDKNDRDWEKQELKAKLKIAGTIQYRVSDFEERVNDQWANFYGAKVNRQSILKNADSEDNHNIGPEHNAVQWNKFNESTGGLGLTSTDMSNIKICVGELVASSKDNGDSWQLGALRWLINTDNQKMDMGIMMISENTVAVGVRGITGVGKGCEYFRALVYTNELNGQKIQTIVVPANTFDRSSVLILSHDRKIKYMRLEKLVDTTSSYSQFQFDFIDKPEGNAYLDKYFPE